MAGAKLSAIQPCGDLERIIASSAFEVIISNGQMKQSEKKKKFHFT
jgi:hypothetical protein